MKPTLRQLNYLQALYRQGSFSKAAQSCFVTQSTFSAGIKELENILGQPVVDRSTRKAKLTIFGQEVLSHARIIDSEIQTILAKAQSTKEPLSGPLRMGVIPTIAPYFLPDFLPKARENYPNLELRIFEDLTARLIEKLHAREIDIALIAFPYETPGLDQHVVFEENFLLAAPKDKDFPNTCKINDLEGEKLLLLDDGHCLRDHALQACRIQAPNQDNKTFGATSLGTLIHMVAEGYGMTLLPEMMVRKDILPENIQLIDFKNPKPGRKIGFVWRGNDPMKKDYVLLTKLSSRA